MTDPLRLLDASPNQTLRSLLSSGLDDAPDANALPKVAAALGLSTVALTASSLTAAQVGTHAAVSAKGAVFAAGTSATALGPAATLGPAASSTGAASLLGGTTALALGKTLLGSMLAAGTLSVGTVAVYEHTHPGGASAARVERVSEASRGSEQRPPARAGQAPTPTTPGQEGAAPTLQRAEASSPPDSMVGRPSPESAARSASASRASATETSAVLQSSAVQGTSTVQETNAVPGRAGVLAREVRQIDSARQALEARDADSALAALDSYQRSRVVGLLDREALLLKIEALSQKQDLEQVKTLARQYLARFPTDTHAPRLRALLATTSSNVQTFPGE